jgi:competence protein ComEC
MVMGWGNTPARVARASAAVVDAWITAENGRFALFFPVFMGAGVLLYFQSSTEPVLLPAILLTACGFTGATLAHHPLPKACLLCAALTAAGLASAGIATWRAPPWAALPRTAAIVSGTVASVEALPEGRRVTIEAPSLDGGSALARRLRIRLRDTDALRLSPGDTVRVRALLQPPPAPAYPGGWDMQRDAFFTGMAGYGFAIGPTTLVAPAAHGRFQGFREVIAARVMTALPGENGAIAATLLTGLGDAIPQPDRQAFQSSGLAHLLAVAGLHMGIVMGMFFMATRLALAANEHTALYWPTKRIAALTSLAAGLCYLALTGGHVPILRSFSMACLVVLGMLTGRRALSLRALALAAVGLMVFAPQEVVGVSFQMSFSAVLALVAGYEALQPALARLREGAWRRRVFLYVASLALTSLLAGTASLPFAAYHFGTATLFYVPANLLAVPLTAFWVMPCCLASLALMPFGWEHAALAPAGWGISLVLGISRTVAAWPDSVVRVPPMPGYGLALVALGLAWLGLWRSRLRLAGLAPLAAGLLAPLAMPVPDLVVSMDSVAARIDGQVFVEQSKRAGMFAREAPARVWGQTGIPFPADDGGRCNAAGCHFAIHGQAIVLVRQPAATDCGRAAVAISTGKLGAGCLAPVMIDAGVARVVGATALFFAASGVREITDRSLRGTRPWVFATHPRLPPAQTE